MIKTILLTVFLFYTQTFCQGQLFTKEEANQRFGPVLKSIEIQLNVFNNFTNNNTNHLMFRISDNQAIILDGNRNVLYPAGLQVNQQDVFTVYSTAVIKDLIAKGRGISVFIEQRRDVLSVSSGIITMEVGTLCPPFCQGD